jgi:hypothetical protein
MDRAKAATEVKAASLRTQVRLLSAILEPSRQWRDFADNAEEDNLSDSNSRCHVQGYAHMTQTQSASKESC